MEVANFLHYFVCLNDVPKFACVPILSNKVMRYLSSISLELYLAQMVIFRFIEKLRLLYVFGDGYLSFIFVCLLTVGGLIAVIALWKLAVKLFWRLFRKKSEVNNEKA